MWPCSCWHAVVRPAGREPLPDFIKSRAVQGVARLAEQVVREGHALEGRTRLELAMQIGGYIPDLNHNWVACRFINFYRLGSSEIPFAVSRRASVVTRVGSNTLAVAARKWATFKIRNSDNQLK
jgi:hypothetical protein